MNKIEVENLVAEIIMQRSMNQLEKVFLKDLLLGHTVYPCRYRMQFKEIWKFVGDLKDIGLEIDFQMNKGPYDAAMDVVCNGLSNYKMRRRKEIITDVLE